MSSLRCSIRPAALVLAAWAAAGSTTARSMCADEAPPRPSPIRGTIDLAAVTGAAALPGGRVLLTAEGANAVVVIADAAVRLATGKVTVAGGEHLRAQLAGKVDLEDLQDAAAGPAGAVYLLASHARTRFGDAPEARYRFGRLRFDAAGRLVEAGQTGALLDAIVGEVPFLGDSIRRPPAKAGLCLEGLTVGPAGELLIGVRSPTVTESKPRPHGGQEDAVVVPVRSPEALFLIPPKPVVFGEVAKLDLHGQGLRALSYDPARKGYWLLSGLSVQPGHPVKAPWSLWFWDGASSPREAPLPAAPALESPSALCVLSPGASARLLIVQGAQGNSPYLLLPLPDHLPPPGG
jgi:hypothetical protein